MTQMFPSPTTRSGALPGVRHFAILAGIEAALRGILISVMPLAIYKALGSAEAVSRTYFLIGLVAFSCGLLVPWAAQILSRRWTWTLGCVFYLCGMVLGLSGKTWALPLALMLNAMGTATVFVCFNAYMLDYVARADLARGQSMQAFFAAAPWMIGPVLGVWLRAIWEPLPFVLGLIFAVTLLVMFWVFRLGNGKEILRAAGPASNPLAYLGRFAAQPRLIAGWLFAVIRTCGWWVFVVYLPIYCAEAGMGDRIGGISLSFANALLFLTPLINRWVRRVSVRRAVQLAFAGGATLFLGAALASPLPGVTLALLMAASMFLIILDVVGGLPFLMAVKPSERTDMAAVYSSFRDVGSILTPGAAWLVLLVAPLPGVFAVSGLTMLVGWAISSRLHPRLGEPRKSRRDRISPIA